MDQQQELHRQYYRYEPRDPMVRDHFDRQRQAGGEQQRAQPQAQERQQQGRDRKHDRGGADKKDRDSEGDDHRK